MSRVLRGRTPAWPSGAGPEAERAVVDSAEWHGVVPLVGKALAASSFESWPPSLRAELISRARQQAVIEALRSAEAAKVIAALSAARLEPLVLKGTHLAHTCYPASFLRPRLDLDLLVKPTARAESLQVLERLGYRKVGDLGGALVTHQSHLVRQGSHGVRHFIDLHWKIADPQVFADALTYDELARRSIAIPTLDVAARGPSVPDMLLLACIHRVAHHRNSTRLLWLFDLHLLARALTPSAVDRFVRLAGDTHMAAVCAAGLELARRLFETPWPAPMSALGRSRPVGEASPAYLAPDRRRVDDLVADLRALRPWRARLQLLCEHLLPSAAYMFEAYRSTHAALLPLLYVDRVIRGAPKWLRRS